MRMYLVDNGDGNKLMFLLSASLFPSKIYKKNKIMLAVVHILHINFSTIKEYIPTFSDIFLSEVFTRPGFGIKRAKP